MHLHTLLRMYTLQTVRPDVMYVYDTISNVMNSVSMQLLWHYCKVAVYVNSAATHRDSTRHAAQAYWCLSSDRGTHLKLWCGEELLLHQGQRCHTPMVGEVVTPSHSIYTARAGPIVGEDSNPSLKSGIIYTSVTSNTYNNTYSGVREGK